MINKTGIFHFPIFVDANDAIEAKRKALNPNANPGMQQGGEEKGVPIMTIAVNVGPTEYTRNEEIKHPQTGAVIFPACVVPAFDAVFPGGRMVAISAVEAFVKTTREFQVWNAVATPEVVVPVEPQALTSQEQPAATEENPNKGNKK